MNRRSLLQRMAVIAGGMVLSAPLTRALAATNTSPRHRRSYLVADKAALLNEIGEVIIPTTDTPGAKAAQVGEFITLLVNDCYDTKDRKQFWEGLDAFEKDCMDSYKKSFMEMSAADRIEVLKKWEADAMAKKAAKSKEPKAFFAIKQLVMMSYFSSEIGCTQALAYDPIPGKYEGCVPLAPGQKAWAM